MMKTKRNLISVTLLPALLLVAALLALPGVAQAPPPPCQEACVTTARAAANVCLKGPASELGTCLEGVLDDLQTCLATCHE